MKENSIFKGSSLLIGCILMIIGFSLIEYFPEQQEFKIIFIPTEFDVIPEGLVVIASYILSIAVWLEKQPKITHKILSITNYRMSSETKKYIRWIILSLFVLFWALVLI